MVSHRLGCLKSFLNIILGIIPGTHRTINTDSPLCKELSSSDMVGQEPLFRVRQKHSRSRTGCITCRGRHIRCEEQRPRCSNCERASKKCLYAPEGQPLICIRSKTKLPGVAAPWQLTPQISVAQGDPFDALPIAMPFQSMEMLRFFMQTNSPVGHFVPPRLWKENVASKNMDSTFCRGLILISAAFFAGHAGSLREFESVYLHHKLESMRTINMWLSQPKTQLNIQCLNLIGTLILTEAYLGYDTAAKHHLGGLKKLLDFRQQQCFSAPAGYQGSSQESGLVDRYNILAQAITKAKSRLDCNRGSSKRQLLSPFHLSTKNDKMVESIRLMPYFFVSLNVENDKVVDITKPVDELRFLVSLLNPLVTSTAQKQVSLSAGDVALIILNANRLHAESLFSVQHFVNKSQEADKLACTWRTFVAARYCFWYGVLGLSKLGSPIEVDLPSHLYTLLLEDVFSSASAPALNQRDTDLWIWIVFSAAIALKRFWQALRDCCGLRLVEEFHGMIVTQIKAWEKFRNVRAWYSVEDALKHIAWPEQQYQTAITVWDILVDADL